MKKIRLIDEYKTIGFRPTRALVDDRYSNARIVLLKRRKKKVYAPVVEAPRPVGTITKSGRCEISRAAMLWSTFASSIGAFDAGFATL